MMKVTQTEVLNFLGTNTFAVSANRLGFDPMEIGNKSVYSGTAMA